MFVLKVKSLLLSPHLESHPSSSKVAAQLTLDSKSSSISIPRVSVISQHKVNLRNSCESLSSSYEMQCLHSINTVSKQWIAHSRISSRAPIVSVASRWCLQVGCFLIVR